MPNKKCDHKSFWEIYKIINFRRTFSSKSWIDFKCKVCHKKCNAKWEWYNEMHKNPVKKYLTYFLWMLPAIILIFLVAFKFMCSFTAIIIIIIFHFWAMYYIIKSKRLKITKKSFFNFG